MSLVLVLHEFVAEVTKAERERKTDISGASVLPKLADGVAGCNRIPVRVLCENAGCTAALAEPVEVTKMGESQDIYKEFGAYLRQYRVSKGSGLREIAQKAG